MKNAPIVDARRRGVVAGFCTSGAMKMNIVRGHGKEHTGQTVRVTLGRDHSLRGIAARRLLGSGPVCSFMEKQLASSLRNMHPPSPPRIPSHARAHLSAGAAPHRPTWDCTGTASPRALQFSKKEPPPLQLGTIVQPSAPMAAPGKTSFGQQRATYSWASTYFPAGKTSFGPQRATTAGRHLLPSGQNFFWAAARNLLLGVHLQPSVDLWQRHTTRIYSSAARILGGRA